MSCRLFKHIERSEMVPKVNNVTYAASSKATRNVDGQFWKAGFKDSQVWEIHGSIHRLQCAQPCSDTVYSISTTIVE